MHEILESNRNKKEIGVNETTSGAIASTGNGFDGGGIGMIKRSPALKKKSKKKNA